MKFGTTTVVLIFTIPAASWIVIFFYCVGLICAIYALWSSRTPQGAAAWAVGLISLPFVSLPLFLIFGTNRFRGYVRKRREFDAEAQSELKEIESVFSSACRPEEALLPVVRIAQLSSQPAFSAGNELTLLIDAEQTYSKMLEEIEKSEKYVLLQFYTFRADGIGKKFVDLLIRKVQTGVKIFLLWDEIGTDLSRECIEKLKSAGIEVSYFRSTKRWLGHFQINFRNHRKVLVVDGRTVFVGGLNIGDEYLGQGKMGAWRDTQLQLSGPAALSAQFSFFKDWHWATEKILDLDWRMDHRPGSSTAGVLETGPADELEACLLLHLTLIHSATRQIWISNPYFVPPEGLMNALATAALRGVDVRILLPSVTDNKWVGYASEIYIERLLKLGVKFFRYQPGFIHQKVMLIDERAIVGSANLDFRSLFINFEIMAITSDRALSLEVTRMLERDFARSKVITLTELARRSMARQVLVRAVNLMAPIL